MSRWLVLAVLVLVAVHGAACARVLPPTPPPPTTAPAATSLPAAPTAPALPPTATAVPTSPPSPPNDPPPPLDLAAQLADIAAAQRIPNDRVRLARALTGDLQIADVARTQPLDVQVGAVRQFWVSDIVANRNEQIMAELRYAGPIVLMYVEQGAAVDQAALEQAARTFEDQIYPRTRSLFGSEAQPGVDGDNRIVVLNVARITGGIIGYFSARDTVPQSVNRFSNEHEMFYMNLSALQPGTPAYLDTLAHEFQHMIHWNEQRMSSTWFNEGNSTLSQDLNGYVSQSYVLSFLGNPDTQLTAWGIEPSRSIAHYGAAHLFMRYIYAHYANEPGVLIELIRADAGNKLDAFVAVAARRRPDLTSFSDLFAEWAIANLLNNPNLDQGQFGYAPDVLGFNALPATVQPRPLLIGEELTETVRQFAADYFELPGEAQRLVFAGNPTIPLAAEHPHGYYAWWSGRGDSSIAALTRRVDLRGVQQATLNADLWFEIEDGYDYAFVTVSTDDGLTWQTLAGESTTDSDPHGANYGNGLTGTSGQVGPPDPAVRGVWVREAFDLSPVAGQEVLLRFWLVNDEGYNAPGLLLDNFSIPEIGWYDDVEQGADGWQADGFVRVTGELAQQWELRLIQIGRDNSVSIVPIELDANASADLSLAAHGGRTLLMVTATTPHTTEPARYTLRVE